MAQAVDEKQDAVDYGAFLDANTDIKNLLEKMQKENDRDPLFDLTNSVHHDWIRQCSELFLKCNLVKTDNKTNIKKSFDDLTNVEYSMFNDSMSKNKPLPLMFFNGIHNARSKLALSLLDTIDLTIIMPMWGEHERMQPKSDEFPHGEDFIRYKINQMKWLFDGSSHKWNLLFVDDGCPNSSGKAAIELVNKYYKDDKDTLNKIQIEFLQDAIDKKIKNFEDLASVNDSRKGGAIKYGFHKVLEERQNNSNKNDVYVYPKYIIYTDSDLSSDLSQCGLLLNEMILENKDDKKKMVIADRYDKGIFSHGHVMGTFKTNQTALYFRAYYRSKLLPSLANLNDTQCGFKIMPLSTMADLLNNVKNYGDMFDMELLLLIDKLYGKNGGFISNVGVVWLHSAALTNFGVFVPNEFAVDYGKKHYKQLQSMINIHNDWYKDSDKVDQTWIQFIKDLKWEEYFNICTNVFKSFDNYNLKTFKPSIDDLKNLSKQQ